LCKGCGHKGSIEMSENNRAGSGALTMKALHGMAEKRITRANGRRARTLYACGMCKGLMHRAS
jgi:hypothetical protein